MSGLLGLGFSRNISVTIGTILFLLFFATFAHAALTDGLLSFWKLNEVTPQASDATGNGHTGFVVGGAFSKVGNFGSSIYLDGSGYISLPKIPSILQNNNRTISLWFKADPAQFQNNIWGAALYSAGVNSYHADFTVSLLKVSNTEYGIYIRNDYDDYYSNEFFTADSSWHNLAIVYSSSPKQEIYLDGQLLTVRNGYSDTTESQANPDNIYLGSAPNNGGESNFVGSIDDVSIWDSALTQGQIDSIYNSGVAVSNSAPGLVALYHMDDTIAPFAGYADSSSDYPGAVGNSSPISCNPNCPISTTGINPGDTAQYFNGSSRLVFNNLIPDFSPYTPMSISLWINPSQVQSDTVPFSATSNSTGCQWGGFQSFFYIANGMQVTNYLGAAWWWGQPAGWTPISTGQWSNIVSTMDSSGNMKFYKDGQFIGAYSSTSGYAIGGNYLWSIGGGGDCGYNLSNGFIGAIQSVATWNKELSSDEVAAIYAQNGKIKNPSLKINSVTVPSKYLSATSGVVDVNFAVSDTNSMPWVDVNYSSVNLSDGLIALWHLDDSSGTIVDSSVNGFNGIPSGGITYGQTGKFGTSVGMSGSSSFITANTNPFVGVSSGTISMWVKPNQNIGMTDQGLFDTYPCQWNALRVYGSGSGSLHFELGGGGDATVPIPDWTNQWHLVTETFDAGTISLYLDGTLSGQTSGTPSLQSFTLGAYNTCDAHYFTGQMDETAIWNRSLSQSEIELLYTLGAPISTKLGSGYIAQHFDLNADYCSSPSWPTANLASPINCSVPWDVSALPEGQYTITVTASNGVSGESVAKTGSHTVIVDNTPPTTSVNGLNPHWQLGDETISFTCSDASTTTPSGCNSLFYRVDFDPSDANSWGSWNSSSPNPYADAVGGNTGTPTGNVTFDASGKLGSAVQFDGSSNYVTTSGNNSILNSYTDGQSISFWAKIPNNQTNRGLLNKGTFSNDQGDWAFISDWPGIGFRAYSCPGNPTFWYNGTNVFDNAWHHIVGVITASQLELFVDGVQVTVTGGDTINCGGTPTFHNTPITFGGYYSTGYLYNAELDQVSVWDHALTQGEVTSLYNGNAGRSISPSESGLIGLWNFDQSSAINFTSDGNYGVEYYSVDNSGNTEPVKSAQVLIGPHGKLTTYNADGNARSFFAQGETVDLRFDANFAAHAPIIISKSGVVVDSGVLSLSIERSDINTFDYNATAPIPAGWYDVNVGAQYFEKAFYVAPTWVDIHQVSIGGEVYPFSFDFNLSEPGVAARWFYPLDTNVTFEYGANAASVRVLDCNSTNACIEIPSQIYATKTSGQNVISANIVFLVSVSQSEMRHFVISYSPSAYATNYVTDLTTTQNSFVFNFGNSQLLAAIDVNKGGMISNLSSVFGSKSNFNSGQYFSNAPQMLADGVTSNASDLTNPKFSQQANGSLISQLTVGGKRNAIDYNRNYVVYAKNPYLLVTTAVTSRAADTLWDYYTDSFSSVQGSTFTSYADLVSGSITDGAVTASSSVLTLGDANFVGFYNYKTLDGLGQVFIDRNSSVAFTPVVTMRPQTSGAFWRRNANSIDVALGDKFVSNGAIVFFNPWNKSTDLNDIFTSLKNPLTLPLIGTTDIITSTPPSLLDMNYVPHTTRAADTNDSVDINCFASWHDALMMDHVVVTVTGPDLNDTNTFYAPALVNDFNVTDSISKTRLNAGTVTCTFVAYNIAGNSTSMSETFVVSDTKPPSIVNTNTPDSNAAIDPNVTIAVDANIAEYTAIVGDVNFYLQKWDTNTLAWTDLGTTPMVFDTNSPTNHYHYVTSFTTPADESLLRYRTSAYDGINTVAFSSWKNLYSLWDWTWDLNSSQLFDNNNLPHVVAPTNTILAGDFNIRNTGDVNMSFIVSSDWFDKSFVAYAPDRNALLRKNETTSGYALDVNVGQSVLLSVYIKAKPFNAGLESFDVNVHPVSALGVPQNAGIATKVLTSSGGSFLYVDWTVPTNVTQGDTNITLLAKITNIGSSDANTILFDWNLPASWIVTSGLVHEANPTLVLSKNNGNISRTVVVSIPDTAPIGIQTLSFAAGDNNDVNKINVYTTTIEVLKKAGTTVIVTPPSGGGSLGGGGGNGGAGSGGIFTTPEQVQTFFSVREKFELIRGRDNVFLVRIKNPFKDRNLSGMTGSVSGLLSKYLSLENPQIGDLAPGEEKFLRVSVVAPTYFDYGKHDLTFTINGFLNSRYSGVSATPFTFENKVVLVIHEIDRNEALRLIGVADGRVQDVVGAGFYSLDMSKLLLDANSAFDLEEYEQAKSITEQIAKLADTAFADKVALDALDANINSSVNDGIDVKKSQRLLTLAQLAFARGEFVKAGEVLRDAQLTYGLETKGAFNVGYFLMHNWGPVSIAIIILYFVIFLGYLLYTRSSLLRGINRFGREQDLLLRLIKETQKLFFVDKKITMNDYQTSVEQYEKRISETVQGVIESQNALTNLFSLKSKSTKLREERSRLLETLRMLQMKYYNKGTIETGIFHAQQKSLNTRLSEIDKNIAYNDARRTVLENSGIMKHFWKQFFKIFK